ncbi:tyrosinase family protein [Frankia sp. AgPm24]|uniref:DUF7868 domain-containing protein n=1 Tax=Frankia sp. AgPm24 TaxID=631128 RepID=UPI00200F593A|nr:tyrosinase family protein [Frankia sp. AgPm24]MCK9921475.1 tyrosinase family protein [Frankia sp. AgPm24]
MANVRSNVYDLGGTWADPILWYARGVAVMKALPIANPKSWRFLAAIHGFNQQLWTQRGYLSASDQLPSSSVQSQFWAQCQHASWYFLPWHRGYVYAFEDNLRAAVASIGGPTDWTLPYWNYFGAGQNALPPAFASPTWPDGGTNPLYVPARYGPNGDGNVTIPLSQVNLAAMNETVFTGVSSGGSPGFGGIDTGFSHTGSVPGRLENQPHNMVHLLVGGSSGGQSGLMANPDSAGLDPIFWLHHANIDRLWESWNTSSAGHTNPTNSRWIGGPAVSGQRPFVMPLHTGSTWTFTPGQVVSLTTLGYSYATLTPTAAAVPVSTRLERLGFTDQARTEEAQTEEAQAMPENTNVELVGASSGRLPIQGRDVHGHVRLDPRTRRKVISSLTPELSTRDQPPAPDRVFLNVENVRGQSDTAAFNVYVGVPEDEDPADHPELLADGVAPFGLRNASEADSEHAGQGLTFALEITDIVDRLHLQGAFDVDSLPVRIVPVLPITDRDAVSIGRISVFREGR